jgi:hypothetical protein
MVWDVLDDEWERGIGAARTYHADHGDLRVPARYRTRDGFPLGRWVSVRRLNRNRLSASRIVELDALGMVWDPFGEDWRRAIESCREFLQQQGHLRVPSGYTSPDGLRLGDWIEARRSERRKQKLAPE